MSKMRGKEKKKVLNQKDKAMVVERFQHVSGSQEGDGALRTSLTEQGCSDPRAYGG